MVHWHRAQGQAVPRYRQRRQDLQPGQVRQGQWHSACGSLKGLAPRRFNASETLQNRMQLGGKYIRLSYERNVMARNFHIVIAQDIRHFTGGTLVKDILAVPDCRHAYTIADQRNQD